MKRELLVGISFLFLLGCDLSASSQQQQVIQRRQAAPGGPAAPAAAPALRPADKNVDEILAAYANARGGKDKLLALKSVRMKGTMSSNRGVKDAPISIEKKRAGNKFVRRLELPGSVSVQAVDGAQTWELSPAVGITSARPMPEDASRRFQHQTPIEGPLVDPKGKGHQVEVMGIQKLEGGEAYRLKVRYKDGDENFFLLDTKTFLPVQMIDSLNLGGQTVEAVTTFKDYRKVGGVLFPFVEEAKLPIMEQTIKWSQIDLDVPVEDAGFKMPAS